MAQQPDPRYLCLNCGGIYDPFEDSIEPYCNCKFPRFAEPFTDRLARWWRRTWIVRLYQRWDSQECGLCGDRTPSRHSNICMSCYMDEKFGYLRDEAWL